MGHDKEFNDNEQKQSISTNPGRHRYRHWIWGLVILNVIGPSLLFFLASGIQEYKDWASLVVVGILGLLSLDVVIISALTSRETVEIMRGQEWEMTEQRRAMQKQWQSMCEQQSIMSKMLQQTMDAERPLLVVRQVGSTHSKDLKGSVRPFICVQNEGRTAARNVCIFFDITDDLRMLVFPMRVNECARPATLPMLAPNEKVQFTGNLFSEIIPVKNEISVAINGVDVDTAELTIFGSGFYESLSGVRYDLEPFAFEFVPNRGWHSAAYRIVDADSLAIQAEAIKYVETNKE